jgi:hypothetical protein
VTNTSRIIVDFLRRTALPWTTILFAFVWWSAEQGPLRVQWALAGSMLIAEVCGPVAVFAMLTPRAVQLLPISRREIWLARWWLGFTIPVALSTAGKLAGALGAAISGDPAIDWSALSLSILYDATFPALFLGLIPFMRGPWMWVGVAAYAGGLVWPIVLIDYLPTTWLAFVQSPIALAVAASLALGLNGYRFSPEPRPYAEGAAGIRARHEARPIRPVRFEIGARLTGLPKLVWWEWVLTLRNIAVIVLGYIVVAGGFMLWQEPPSLEVLLREIRLLPFDRETRAGAGFPTFFFLGFLAVGATYSSTLHSDFLHSTTRSLRALPIGTGRLLSLMMAMPVLTWLTLCGLMSGIQIVATGRPPQVFHEFLLLFPALDVLARAIQLRWRRDTMAWHFVVAMVTLVVIFERQLDSVPLLTIVGGIFAAATLLNYLTLTRSRAPYRARSSTATS